jgi:hypothetical protein
MTNLFLAFILLSVAIYLALKVLDLVFARFNILPKPDINRPQSKTDIAIETLGNSFAQIGEFPSIDAHHAVNAANVGDFDAGAVASEVLTNAEGLAEGVQALAESAGETLTILIEGLAN